jgi:outer membrane protein OmpA-like peptidoglycan-associated protein
MSLLADLVSTLDNRSLRSIASAVGEPEQSVSRGMQSSIGTVLGGMASKAQNPDALQGMLNLLPAGARDVTWSNLASNIGDTGSPLISAGKQMLSGLFGTSQSAVTTALGNETGLGPGATSSLLTMAAPMVMSLLSRKVRDEGLSMAGLGSLLQREIPAIHSGLPASLTHLLWGREQEVVSGAAVSGTPVVAQTVVHERKSAAGWLLPLILLALIPSCIWLFHQMRRPNTVVVIPPRAGLANRVAPLANRAAPTVSHRVDLYFDTGSSRLRPESQAKLNEFAREVTATKDAHVTVNGYTDNVGNAASNLKLSQDRANAVAANLEGKGVSEGNVTVQGYGQEQPTADNGTAAGRAQNRRVSVELGE